MSILKRYNSQTQQWEPITSAPAAGVFTDNPLLTTGDDPIQSVEDVLLKTKDDIDLLRKNVSWLAKHGGGGFGPGGGGGITSNNATVQIFDPADNSTDVSSFVWSNSYTTLSFKINSNVSTSTYTVYIKINGAIKSTMYGVKRNTTQTVTTASLGLGAKDATILITAIDESENEYSKTCKVVIASVILQQPTVKPFTQDIMQTGSPIISLRYKVSIAGDYKLYYSDSNIYWSETLGWCDSSGALENSETQRSQYIDILNSGTSYMTININLTNIYNTIDNKVQLISPNVGPGDYIRHFRLVKSDNNSIYSPNVSCQISVVKTNGILVSPAIGVDENTRYSVTADAILNLRFTTYAGEDTTGTYSYRLFVGGTFKENGDYNKDGIELTDLANNGQVFGNIISSSINIANYPEAFPELGNYQIIIYAEQYPKYTTGICYVSITKKIAEFVNAYKKDIIDSAIFDYTFWDTSNWNKENSNDTTHIQIDNPNFNYGDVDLNAQNTHKSYLDLYRVGADSGLAAGGSVYYKMTHTAAGRITCDDSVKAKWFPKNNIDNTSLIRGYDYNFSLQVAYSLDVEVDDEATVFNMGNYDINTGLGNGIVITAHNYYVKFDNVIMNGVLQDSTFTQFDLVCSSKGNGLSRWVYIYQNGVLLQAAKHEPSNSSYTLSDVVSATIACKNITGSGVNVNAINPINVNFYAIRLFNKGLNDGQIVCSYINNYVNHKRLSTGQLDADLLNTMLKNNLINSDEKVEKEGLPISNVYDFKSGEYDWGITSDGENVNLGNLSDLPDRAGIPVVVLSTGWTYDQFTKTGSDFDTNNQNQTGIFRYIYPGNPTGISCEVDMNPQGTTTLGYTIKNLDIRFKDLLFSPKNTWFPEQVFTLKADVVDSAHINNAAIGTFVNDCVQNGITQNSHFPAKALIETYTKNRKTLPENLTFKATIEGFPIVLIMDFSKEDGTRDPRVLGIYSFNLGRESYYNQGMEILTRLRNQSGTVLAPSDISFPSLFGKPQASDIDSTYSAFCFEGSRSVNTTSYNVDLDSMTYDYAIVKLSTGDAWYPIVTNIAGYVGYDSSHMIYDNGNPVEWNSKNVQKMSINHNGYFWSPDTSFSTSLWDLKYFSNNSTQDAAWNQFAGLSGLSEVCLAKTIATKLPYRKGSVVRAIGGDGFKIWKITSAAGDTMETVDTGNTYNITRPQAQEPICLSIQNSAFYYVTCQLFGLIDNYGKNLQFKYWGRSDSANDVTYKWSPTFYDMDTALGVSNTGSEDVPATTWEESIINLPDNKVRFMFSKTPNALNGYPKTGANPTFTVYSNKLWGSLEDPELHSSYTLTYGSSNEWRVYSKMWNDIRSKMFTNVETFVDKYLTTSLSKCGEFLYNYDYYTKYLNTPQYSMLHGTRISFIRSWLKDRITFLDSIFGYKLAMDNLGSYINLATPYLNSTSVLAHNTSWNNAVTFAHNSGSITMPIKTNKSAIVRTTVGNNATAFKYVQKNTNTDIKFAEVVGTQGVQTVVNNSDCIINLPNLHSISLNGINANSAGSVKDPQGNNIYDNKFVEGGLSNIFYQYGSLSSLKAFDISGISTINSNFDMFNLFKTWDETGVGGSPRAFALQDLNLSKTSSNNITANLSGITSEDTNIPSIYRQPFTNLNNVDISNSQVSSVIIPSGVTLQSLNIENSYISELTLNSQPLLNNLSFNKCSNITKIELIKCNALSNLIIDNTNVVVRTINISNCNNLQTILIDGGNKLERMPSISIEDCPNLHTVIIRNIRKTELTEKIDSIRVINTPELRFLEVSNCDYTTIFWSGAERLTKLNNFNISNSLISRVDIVDYSGDADRNYINLRGFKSDTFKDEEGIVQVNMRNNTAITEVYFDNVSIVESAEKDGTGTLNVPEPFVLNMAECFAECKNLTRVYGYIHIAGERIFNKCVNFSLLGIGLGNNSYSNYFISTHNKNGLKQIEPTKGNHGAFIDEIYDSLDSNNDWVSSFSPGATNTTVFHPTQNYPKKSNFYNEDSWNLLRVDENGKFRYAWICPKPKFGVWDDKYTNAMISGSSVSGAFSETQCSSFEVYYALFNCDSDEINISGLFTSCPNISFIWYSDTNDNSPNRYTFMNCTGATAASNVFATGGLFKLYSPYKENGTIIPGTYTPLKNKCLSMSRVISGRGVMDNNVLRTLDDDKFAVKYMNAFTAVNFVDDVNNLTYDEYIEATGGGLYGGNILTGNVSNLLIDCPDITNLDEFLNDVDYIDYNTACGNVGSVQLPYIITMVNSFRSVFANGDLLLEKLYKDSECCESLKGIYSCFRVSSTINNMMLKLNLSNGIFKKFINLEVISLDPEETGGEDPFTGYGLKKYYTDEFPYDIFDKCPKLREIIAFFQGCDFTDMQVDLNLPGDLFKNNPELEITDRLFYNIKIKQDVARCKLTSNSFENCPKLKKVSYMFACNESGILNAFMGSEIPRRLFYHGEKQVTKTITGCNKDEIISGCTYVENGQKWIKDEYTYSGQLDVIDKGSGVIRINPATYIINNGVREYLVPTNSLEIESTTFTYNQPNTNISDMTGCFQGGDWIEYGSNNFSYTDEPEINGDYSPYKYILANGQWIVNTAYNPYPKTYMWQYNGDWMKYDEFLSKQNINSSELDMLDDAYGCVIRNYRISRSDGQAYGVDSKDYPNLEMKIQEGDNESSGKGVSLTLSGKFCFAPDLLRYCITNPSLGSLFSYCGPKAHTYTYCDSTRYGTSLKTPTGLFYGLKGRLVPYMFKPVSGLTSLKNMFMYCKFISSYVKTTTDEQGNTITNAYPIPESLMKYFTSQNINLSNAFAGWYFPAYSNLDVFRVSRNVTYTLEGTFQWPLFSNRLCTENGITQDCYVPFPATKVENIFNDGDGYVRAASVNSVFNAQESPGMNENTTTTERNSSVQFNSVFAIGGYTGGTDMYCFAGYTDPIKMNSSWVNRFSPIPYNANNQPNIGIAISPVVDNRNYVVFDYSNGILK